MTARQTKPSMPLRWPLVSVAILFGMTALAWASVPIYRAVCQQFGFGGTPRIAPVDAVTEVRAGAERGYMVRFNADTAQGLHWQFEPLQAEIALNLGDTGLAYYAAENLTDREITGTATFNVTPLIAAKYFVKMECFCFTEQTLGAGARAEMPVSFYIDPAILDDPALSDLATLTLSYTFFETPESRARPQNAANHMN